jgi:hypothetical protein
MRSVPSARRPLCENLPVMWTRSAPERRYSLILNLCDFPILYVFQRHLLARCVEDGLVLIAFELDVLPVEARDAVLARDLEPDRGGLGRELQSDDLLAGKGAFLDLGVGRGNA